MRIPASPESELDTWSLAALAVRAGSRVLVVRSSAAAAIDERLAERGCTVEVASAAGPHAFADGVTFESVVVADGFEHLDDPFAALGDAASLLAASGQLVIVARNAAHAASRVNEFLGVETADGSPLPPRQYDLPALEAVVGKAGLVIVDRVRVLDASPRYDADADLLARASGPEARVSHFVLVTARADEVVAPKTPTLTEVLQRAIEERDAQADVLRERCHALETDRDSVTSRLVEIEAALEQARSECDDQRIELDARAAALVERVELVDRLHTERRHLELDLAVKDDYIAILRSEVLTRRADYDTLRYEHDDLLRSRHYRAAVFLHRILKAVPFVHRFVTGTTKRVAPMVRGTTPPPPE